MLLGKWGGDPVRGHQGPSWGFISSCCAPHVTQEDREPSELIPQVCSARESGARVSPGVWCRGFTWVYGPFLGPLRNMSLLLLFSFLHFHPQCLSLSSVCLCPSLVISLTPPLHLAPHTSLSRSLPLYFLPPHFSISGFSSHILVTLPSPSLCLLLPLPPLLSLPPAALLCLHLSPVCPSFSFRSLPELAQSTPMGAVAARPLLVPTKLPC